MLMLSPIVPHICATLWGELGYTDHIEDVHWPQYDESALEQDNIQLMVQVNGKLRDKIMVAAEANDEQIKAQALASEKIKKYVADKAVKKIIVVKGRLVNIVI